MARRAHARAPARGDPRGRRRAARARRRRHDRRPAQGWNRARADAHVRPGRDEPEPGIQRLPRGTRDRRAARQRAAAASAQPQDSGRLGERRDARPGACSRTRTWRRARSSPSGRWSSRPPRSPRRTKTTSSTRATPPPPRLRARSRMPSRRRSGARRISSARWRARPPSWKRHAWRPRPPAGRWQRHPSASSSSGRSWPTPGACSTRCAPRPRRHARSASARAAPSTRRASSWSGSSASWRVRRRPRSA